MVGGGGEKRPREENGATEGARPAKAGAHPQPFLRSELMRGEGTAV